MEEEAQWIFSNTIWYTIPRYVIYCNSAECLVLFLITAELPLYTHTGSLFSTSQPFPSAAITNTLNCRSPSSITPNSLQAHGLATGTTVSQVANGTLSNGAAASSTMSVASPATPPQYYTCTQEGQVSTMGSVQLQVRSGTSSAAFVANGGTPTVSDGVCYPPSSCIRPLQPTIPLGMTWVPPGVHPQLYKATPDTPPATPCTAYSGQLPTTPPQQSVAAINGRSTPENACTHSGHRTLTVRGLRSLT